MSDNPDSFDERFSSLEASNRMLSSDVRALTASLNVINDFRIEQGQMSARLRRTRNLAASTAVTMACLLPLVSIVVYLVLLQHVNTLLDEGAQDRYAACQSRNAVTASAIRRELDLAAADGEAAVKAIHRNSAREIAANVVDCERLNPRAKT